MYNSLRYDEQAMENIRNLRAYRKMHGLSRKELARLSNIPFETIKSYEARNPQIFPTVNFYNKLARIFDWDILDKNELIRKFGCEKWRSIKKTLEAEEARQILAAKEREEALNFSFNVGEVYYIGGYNLRYVGKQGIHHCFKSVSGGWSRTYTNNQLVGKEIKPQQEKEEALKYFSKKF